MVRFLVDYANRRFGHGRRDNVEAVIFCRALAFAPSP